MLVLVVIFMITAPLLSSSIHVKLPQGQAVSANEAPASVLVVVDAQGQIHWKDRPISGTDLLAQLSSTAAQNPQTEVQLRADERVPYGEIVKVMGLAHKAGLTRIGFVAEPPSTR
jgi:biopolymer transport protein TolR